MIQDNVADVPAIIQTIAARHRFMMDKLFNNLAIEDDNTEFEEKAEEVDLTIHTHKKELGVERPPQENQIVKKAKMVV
jgi:hypothetical protein